MGWFYVITQDMRESFEGKEVDVFSVINGFSQDQQGCFYGSLAKLSMYCGIKSKTTTQKILKSLVDRGAIIKNEEINKGVKFCSYSVNPNWYTISKIDMGTMSKNDMEGISEIDTNNKEYKNKIESNIRKSKFVKPTLDEVRQYCFERNNNINAEDFINFYDSKGWVIGKSPMKDWKAAVRTWEATRKNNATKGNLSSHKKESVFEHNLREMDKMFGTNIHEQTYGNRTDYDEQ